MNESRQNRRQHAHRGQAHSRGINEKRTGEVKQDNLPAAAGQFDQFNQLAQIIADQQDSGKFLRDIRPRAHRDRYVREPPAPGVSFTPSPTIATICPSARIV